MAHVLRGSLVALTTALVAAPASAQASRLVDPAPPDAYGYRVLDQDAAGCGFDFVDIQDSGTPLLPVASGPDPAEDDGGAALVLAAPFELYGQPAPGLVVSTNGYVGIAGSLAQEDGGDFSNDPNLPAIPDNQIAVAARIFAYHDDLSGFESGGALHHEFFASCPRASESIGDEACTVLQWSDWTFSGDGEPFDLQALLYHTSFEIVLQLRPGATPLTDGTIGIQNDFASIASQYRFDAPLSTDTAVCIFEPRYPPGGPVADLAITKHAKADLDTPLPDQSVAYAIGVTNRGPSPVVGARVEDPLPAALLGCAWTCEASSGSACGATGTGAIDELVELSPGGWVSYVLICEIPPSAGTLINTATVDAPVAADDPGLGNNVATAVVAAAGRVPDGNDLPGPSLELALNGANLDLAWGPSCRTTDVDYEVYAGSIGDFTSHLPVACSSGGGLTLSHPAPAASVYYLVVPASSTFEGSYGHTSAGEERPRSVKPCLPRAIGDCS